MSDFTVETGEGLKSGREILEQLAKSGKFVFHGSTQRLEKLEPRQQMQFNKSTGKSEPDGQPAICAALNYQIAIFRSLISSHVARELGVKNYYSEFGLDKSQPYFKATPEAVALASRAEARGYVHVFDKKNFQPHDDLESRAYQEVKPVYVVEVKGLDLPENIEIVQGPS